MATATIRINGVAGSKTDLALGDTVTLTNATPATTYAWYLLSQPAGTPVAVLSNPTSATASFTVPKEGSYLVKLVVNAGIAGEDTDQVVAAVRELETGDRIPAAGETTEVSPTEGWANDSLNQILHRVTRLGSNGMITGVAAAVLQAGEVVYISNLSTIGSGSEIRTVPRFSKALATTPSHMNGALGVMVQKVGGGGTVVTNERLEVQMFGLMQAYPNLGSGTGTVGDKVYVSDTGTLSLTPGTISRPVGNVVDLIAGTNYSVFLSALDGGGAASSTPTGPAGGVLTGTYPNPSGLQADVDGFVRIGVGTGNVEGDTITIKAANGTGVTKGSNLYLIAGSSDSGFGGDVQIASGISTTGTSGSITVQPSPNTLAGSSVTIWGGNSTTRKAGTATLLGGLANSTLYAGGDALVQGGNNSALGEGGQAIVRGGTAAGSPVEPAYLTLGGAYHSVGTVHGGDALLAGGIGLTNPGGAIAIRGGNSTGNDGGDVTIAAGQTSGAGAGNGGSILIQAGDTNATGTSGGTITIRGGGGSNGDGSITIETGKELNISSESRGILIGKGLGCPIMFGKAGFESRFYGKHILTSVDQAITAVGNTIVPNTPTIRLRPTASLTLTSTPTISIANSLRGHRLVLTNMSPTFTVTLQDESHFAGSGLRLGANTRPLKQYSVIDLVWEANEVGGGGFWLELAYRF